MFTSRRNEYLAGYRHYVNVSVPTQILQTVLPPLSIISNYFMISKDEVRLCKLVWSEIYIVKFNCFYYGRSVVQLCKDQILCSRQRRYK